MDLLQEEASQGDISLSRIFALLGEEGHAMLIVFLSLPYIFPIPVPGLSTISGALIILIAFFLFLKKRPWLPKRYENIKVSAATVLKVSKGAEKFWGYVARFIKPRWSCFHDYAVFRGLNFLVFAVNAFLLSLPLPIPFSNTVPAIAILLCGVGHMEKDGLFILLSYLWCFVVGAFFMSLAMGLMGAKHLL
ncbi:MAG: exopolysaccharide biosynthesis protein [Bacillota bacterium]